MALLFDINEIHGPRKHLSRTIAAGMVTTADDDFKVVGDVALEADVEKRDEGVALAGRVRATLEVPCSRCLEPMTVPVDATFDLRYVTASANIGEDEDEVAAEDLTTAFFDGREIDLAQLIREQFYLALPMKPLCRADCAGLCPECGTNLNVSRCSCVHHWVDPRMAVLQNLLPDEPTKH